MNKRIITSLGLLFYAILATSTYECKNKPSESPESTLEFVGRVKDYRSNYINDRLVILFLNGKEVGRNVSDLGKYYYDKAPNDGLFKIVIPNTFELTEKEITDQKYVVDQLSTIERAKKGDFGAATYIDLGSGREGFDYHFVFPTRNNLKYTIKILNGDAGNISRDILDCVGETYISSDNEVICPASIIDGEAKNIELTEEIEETQKGSGIQIPIDNCLGNTTINQNYSGGESFIHEVNFSLGVNAGIFKRVQAKLGVNTKEESYQKIETNFTAKPKTKMVYTITWFEVWKHGKIQISTEKGLKTIPFKVKTQLKYKINSEKVSCE